MKTCTKCEESKPLSDFPKQERMADGHSSWCKPCKYAAQREWRMRNPDTYKASLRSYYERNKPKYTEQGRAWKAANPDKVKASNARYQKALKARVLDHYGHKCSCDGCSVVGDEFLTFDHINDDGRDHRKTFTKNFYRWLIDAEFPEGFRTLCFNCNIGRHINGGICPHMD